MKTKTALLVLGMVSMLLYIPFLGNGFVSDDVAGLVVAAPKWTLLSSFGFPEYFQIYRTFQYGLYHVFGMTPWPFHLLPVLFHALSTMLVFLIVKRLHTPSVAFLAGVLFGVHPLGTEAVIWISGGNYAELTFFFLLSFLLYLYQKPRGWYGLSLGSFLLCLLTSEKAISLFFIFLCFAWWAGKIKKQWKQLIPYVLLSAIFILFYILKLWGRVQSVSAMAYVPVASGLYNPLTQIPVAISSYLELFVWPKHLTLYHTELLFPWWNFAIRVVITVCFLGMGIVGMVKKKWFGFWICWMLVFLLPLLTPFKIAWVVAERYMYGAQIGLSVLAAVLLHWLFHTRLRVVWYVVVALMVLALSSRLIIRCAEWRNEDTLWIATANASPSSPNAWNNMGDVYTRHGQLDQAVVMFTRAVKINPEYADAYHNLATTYLAMGKLAKAKEQYQQAIRYNPLLWQSYRGLAAIAAQEGMFKEAFSYMDTAIRIAPKEESLLQLRQAIQALALP